MLVKWINRCTAQSSSLYYGFCWSKHESNCLMGLWCQINLARLVRHLGQCLIPCKHPIHFSCCYQVCERELDSIWNFSQNNDKVSKPPTVIPSTDFLECVWRRHSLVRWLPGRQSAFQGGFGNISSKLLLSSWL